MRIAVSTEDNSGIDSRVSHHFGRCPYFALVDIEGQEVRGVRHIENPYFRQHQPGRVPAFIQSQGAEVMISGGMGRRALAFFEQYGIRPATGAAGSVREAIDQYLQGNLGEAGPCPQSVEHGRGHGRGHHHAHREDSEGHEPGQEAPGEPGRNG